MTMPAATPASNADILALMAHAMIDHGGYSAQEISGTLSAAQNARDAEQGQLRLDDGTVVSPEMIANADPATRAQYEQALVTNSQKYQTAAIDMLGQYGLQEYATGPAAQNDTHIAANNDFRNSTEAVRQRLDSGKITMDQATAEMADLLKGMGAAPDRTALETQTAETTPAFAPPPAAPPVASPSPVAAPPTPTIQFPPVINMDAAGVAPASVPVRPTSIQIPPDGQFAGGT